MNNKRGVSLIELALVMIIMIIIAAFAIFNGSNTVDKAEATEIYEEIDNMVKATNGVIIQKELGNYDDEWLKDYYDVDLGNNWYLIYGAKGLGESNYANSNVRKNIGMDTIKRDYRVNYDTGEVMLHQPIQVLGSTVQTYESIRALVNSNKI